MSSICSIDDLKLRPASFRGVSFWVDNDKQGGGRRIVSHEFPMRDTPFHEDLGQKFTTYNVTGYVYGTNSELMKEALYAACMMRGSALLVLPQSIPTLAVCVSVSVARSKDKLGWFNVDMEFREDLGVLGGLFGAIHFVTAIAGAFISLTTAVSADFVRRHQTKRATYEVAQDAVTRVQDIAAGILVELDNASSADADTAALCMRQITALANNAVYYAEPDADTRAARAETIPAIAACVEYLSAALDVDDAAAAFGRLRLFTSTAGVRSTIRAASDTTNNTNEDALVGGFRRLCAAKWAEALAGKSEVSVSRSSDTILGSSAETVSGGVSANGKMAWATDEVTVTGFRNRSEAVHARAELSEGFYDILLGSDHDETLVSCLTHARDLAVRSISENIANMAPVLTVTSATAMPALYWAHRVNGDVERADDIANRNGAIDWMNIGGSFTITARA